MKPTLKVFIAEAACILRVGVERRDQFAALREIGDDRQQICCCECTFASSIQAVEQLATRHFSVWARARKERDLTSSEDERHAPGLAPGHAPAKTVKCERVYELFATVSSGRSFRFCLLSPLCRVSLSHSSIGHLTPADLPWHSLLSTEQLIILQQCRYLT